jgi:hypothetical protein
MNCDAASAVSAERGVAKKSWECTRRWLLLPPVRDQNANIREFIRVHFVQSVVKSLST